MIESRIITAIIYGAFCMSVGCFGGAKYVQLQFVQYKAEQASRAADAERAYSEQLRESSRRTAKAISERDSALSRADAVAADLNAQLERMREQANQPCAITLLQGGDSRKSDADARERCEKLLIESAELLREANNLLHRNAAEHDALANSIMR